MLEPEEYALAATRIELPAENVLPGNGSVRLTVGPASATIVTEMALDVVVRPALSVAIAVRL